jgi:hypothetical protein
MMANKLTMVRSSRVQQSLLLVFLISATGVLNAVKVWPAFTQPFIVKLVGYDQEKREFISEYRIAPSDTKSRLLSKVERDLKTKPNFFGLILRDLNQRRELRRNTLKTLKLGPFTHAKWVNPSPDGRYLLLGFEDPAGEVMTNALIINAADLSAIKEFKMTGGHYILDSEWSANSQLLAILETDERYSKSFVDLISLLLSHPKPLNTISVTFVDVSSGSSTRMQVEKDVRFGTAVITRQATK